MFLNLISHMSHSLTRSSRIDSMITKVLTFSFYQLKIFPYSEVHGIKGRVSWGCLRSFANSNAQIFCQGAQTKRWSMNQWMTNVNRWNWLVRLGSSLFCFLSFYRISGLFTFLSLHDINTPWQGYWKIQTQQRLLQLRRMGLMSPSTNKLITCLSAPSSRLVDTVTSNIWPN